MSWLPEDGTVFGFVNMPLIHLRLAKYGSNHQGEATAPNKSNIFGASQHSPWHSTCGSKSTLKVHKTCDTEGIKMLNAEGKCLQIRITKELGSTHRKVTFKQYGFPISPAWSTTE